MWAAAANAACDVAGAPGPAHQLTFGVPRGDHRVLRLVVDLDELGGVLGAGAAVSDDQRDRLAGVADLGAGEHRMGVVGQLGPGRRRHREVAHVAGQLGGGDDRDQPLGGVGDADGSDRRPRVGTAHHRHVTGSRGLEVVHEAGRAAQNAVVLAAGDGIADAHRRRSPIQSATSGRYL